MRQETRRLRQAAIALLVAVPVPLDLLLPGRSRSAKASS